MKLGVFTKQPREKRSYSVTYEDAMDAGDNVISAEVLSIVPAGLVVSQPIIVNPRVKFFASEGTDSISYTVTLLVKTEDGQEFEDEVVFKVKEIK